MTNAFIDGWYEKNHERYTEELEDVFYEGAEAAQKYLIDKVKKWLKFETDWNMEYDEEGRNLNYGKIDELVKYLEE